MAPEKRSMGERRVHDALDLCLARMRRGEGLERCLVDFADLTEELRPLLLLARDLHTTREASIPAPPRGLEPARERFIAAARAQRSAARAAAGMAIADPAEVDALDTSLARVRAGEPVDAVLAGYRAALAGHLRALIAAAVALGTTPPAPPAPGGLAAARARFLAAVAALAAGVVRVYTNGHAPRRAAEADADIAEALDASLARLRAGERADVVLAGFPPAIADAIRPLIAAAAEVIDLPPAPPAPRGLEPGRARFLEAAAALGAAPTGTAIAAEDAPDVVGTALDAVLRALAAGTALDTALASCPPALAGSVRPLAEMAMALSGTAVATPRAPGELAAGRARFLDVAARARQHHAGVARANTLAGATLAGTAAASTAWWGRLAVRIPGRLGRAAAAMAMAVMLFFGGIVAVKDTAAVANALPGDSAYFIKRLNERLALLTALDPRVRVEIESEFDRRRAAEIAQLVVLRRSADVAVRAALLGVDVRSLADGRLQGLLRVRIPPDGDATAERVLVVDEHTALDLAGFAGLADLPPGALLHLVLRTGGADPRTLALNVRLIDIRAVVPVAAAGPPTAVARVVERPIGAAATPTPGSLVQPLTATPSDPPPATATLPPTVEPALTTTAGSTEKNIEYQSFAGSVIDQPASEPNVWHVARDGCTAKQVVRVDISQVADWVGKDVKNQMVRVRGHFSNAEEDAFVAVKVKIIGPDPNISTGEAIGIVTAIEGDLLTLDSGQTYLIGFAIASDVTVGKKVTLRYRSCGVEVPTAIEIKVVPDEEAVEVEGVVTDLVEGTRFTLVLDDDGDPQTPGTVTVTLDADTKISGATGSLAVGQRVLVKGHFDATGGSLRAETIVILFLSAGGDQGGAPAPTASSEPAIPPAPAPTAEQPPG